MCSRLCLGILFPLALLYAAQDKHGNCDATAAFQKANVGLSSHQYEQAARSLDEIRDCPALSPLELFQAGWLYGRARRFDIALKLFNRVPDSVPDRATHQFAVALAHFELGQYQEANRLLTGLESAGLADSRSQNLLAVSYSKLGLYRESYAVLAREIQKNPADLDTHLNLITVCAEGGDFKGAAEAAMETTKLFPESADAFVSRGAAEALLGQLDLAYSDFSTSAKLDAQRPDIRFFQALMDYKLGKFNEAVQILHSAIQQGMQGSDLHYLLGECLLKTAAGNTEQAIAELNKAIALNADSVSARTLRGKLLLESGQAQLALADLEFAAKEDPEYRSASYNLARAYRAVGRNTEAQQVFARIHDQSSSTVSETGNRRLTDALAPKGSTSQ